MWQEIAVSLILAAGAGFTLWSFYGKFTGKSSCCGGGCTCRSALGRSVQGRSTQGKPPQCGSGQCKTGQRKTGKTPCGCAAANG
ncbi:MAG: hypothetical protein HY916_07745 [Desulfovibrio sp.]|jgi:hypothetical protein|nr:hypothetical protein [Desulfovibrio sp.]